MITKTDPIIPADEKGFTLIEIIAVLVILGVLAAVAVPKFIDLQDDATQKAALSAIAETQSRLSMAYGRYLLKYGEEPARIGQLCNKRTGLNDNSILPIAYRNGIVQMGDDFRVILDRYSTYGRIRVTHVNGEQLDTPVDGRWDLPNKN